jgi:hypothetical protein
LDFVVDPIGSHDYDSFGWAPAVESPTGSWEATRDFSGPNPAQLPRTVLLIQALLMSNEFMFVD